ncbi:YlbL family protein [Nocardioides perillae]|uniref:PDZ domain-containing protein n=1 Tax=Nocardioides perillae TaxID=1119534 RepID=A0A7Y9RS06_9ACTN|nr:PDZ domain-containing protein [Nocardioides perillae]NYG55270.1 PDZ domain-containing protein [Nocardioides perillae]
MTGATEVDAGADAPAGRPSQRTVAGLVAVPLLLVLWLAAALLPVPFVTYEPGLTLDVLASDDGRERIQVQGARTYRTDGELRMTTVYVTQPRARVNLFSAMGAWLDDERAVYPYDAVYDEDETAEETRRESSVQMVSSQDAATAAALRELGYDVTPVVEVLNVTEGLPAEGRLQVRDVIEAVDGQEISSAEQVGQVVRAAGAGTPVEFEVRRDGRERTVTVEPEATEDGPLVGILPGPGYRFPFQVDVEVPDSIGGPSAGLMFSLAIYDTLTPGSLTGGRVVAGTGTVDAQGDVGPIGGIAQKIPAARDAGAGLFLVPPDNCAEALRAPRGDVRLVRAETMHDARLAIEAWVEDPDAELPACTEEG